MKPNIVNSYHSPCHLAGVPESTPVLLAFSGGEDSRVLFDLLLKDSRKIGFVLHVAHFNHCIRGEEAERDARFCESIAKENNIPFHLGKANVPYLAKQNGNSIETEARIQRYAFFEKIMREHNIPLLATAHHADDQVESILLHILRGSGLNGLSGISSCRRLTDGLFITRPMLNIEKSDISDYCSQNNLSFVSDSTNSNTEYSRNHIRASITPEMKKIQPHLCKIFDRLSQSATEAEEFISHCACNFIKTECASKKIPTDKFNALFKAVKSSVISRLFEEIYGATLERVHIDSIIELCQKSTPHSSISLPGKIAAKIANGNLVFDNEDDTENNEPLYMPFKEGELCGNGFKIIIQRNPCLNDNCNGESINIRCDLISNDAYFRYRKDGDIILSGKKHKKVKKLLTEKKLSLTDRKHLPFLISNEEILWIPTVAACDTIKSGTIKKGEDFYKITIIFENN